MEQKDQRRKNEKDEWFDNDNDTKIKVTKNVMFSRLLCNNNDNNNNVISISSTPV